MGLYDNIHAINSTRVPTFVADHSKEIGDYITQANQKHEATTGLMDATEDMLKSADIRDDDKGNYAQLLADAKAHLSTLSSRPSLADATGEAYRLARQVKDRLTPLVGNKAAEDAWIKSLNDRVLKETKDGGIDDITRNRAIEMSRRRSTPVQLDADGRQIAGTGFQAINVAPNVNKIDEMKKFLDSIPEQRWSEISGGDDGMKNTKNRTAFVDKLPPEIVNQFPGWLQNNKPWMAMNERDAMLAASEATDGVTNEDVLRQLDQIPSSPAGVLWVNNMNKEIAKGKSALQAYKDVAHEDARNLIFNNDLNQVLGGAYHNVEWEHTSGIGSVAEAAAKAEIEASKTTKQKDSGYDGVAFDSSLGAVGSKYDGVTGDTKTALEDLNAKLEAVKARTPQGGTVDEDSKQEQYNLEQQIKSLSGLSNLKNAAVVTQYKQLNKDKPGGWQGVKEREIKAKEKAVLEYFNYANELTSSNLKSIGLTDKKEQAYVAKQLANGNYRKETPEERAPFAARVHGNPLSLVTSVVENIKDATRAPVIIVKGSTGQEFKIPIDDNPVKSGESGSLFGKAKRVSLTSALYNQTEDYINTLKNADAKPLDVKGQTWPIRDEALEKDIRNSLPTVALTDPTNSGKVVELTKDQSTSDNLAKARVVGYNHIFGKAEVILHDGTRVLANVPEGVSDNLADKIMNSSRTSRQEKLVGSMIKNRSVPEYLNALGVHEGYVTENPVTHRPFTNGVPNSKVHYALSPNGNGTFNLNFGELVNGSFKSQGIVTKGPANNIDGHNLTLGQAMAFMEQMR